MLHRIKKGRRRGESLTNKISMCSLVEWHSVKSLGAPNIRLYTVVLVGQKKKSCWKKKAPAVVSYPEA